MEFLKENYSSLTFLSRKNAGKLNEKINNLTIIGYGRYKSEGSSDIGYVLRCDCGNEIFNKRLSKVRSGYVKTCGCRTNTSKAYYSAFLSQYKDQILKAGILYISYEQWQNDTIPYWCPVHNDYKLISKASLKKFTVAPCFACGKIVAANKKTKTTKQFIKDSIKIHGDRFNYDKTVYTGSHSYLSITCKEHGDFEQSATDHLSGYIACKGCSPHSGFDKNKSGEMYFTKWSYGLKIFIKFGITNKTSKSRINKQQTRRSGIMYKPTILNIFKFEDGAECAEVEATVKRSFNTGVVDKEEFPDGFSETIELQDYPAALALVKKLIKGETHE